MKKLLILAAALSALAIAPLAQAQPAPAAAATTRAAAFFSEQVQLHGTLYLPAGFNAAAKAPGVVLAPGWGATADSLDRYARALAAKGVVALTIDYRGWGKSGGFLYLGDQVRQEDRLRFSNHTPKLRIRRGRLDPAHQIQDIRNAMTFLQGEAGVDRARIGVLGVDMAGGHVLAVSGMDARVKAAVAVTPRIDGKDEPMKAYIPSAADRAEMIRLARTGAAPATNAEAKARNAVESRLAVAEYKPFWHARYIPATTSILFVIAEKDEVVNNQNHAVAASEALKGQTAVTTVVGARHRFTPAQADEAARVAADWFAGKL